MKDNTVRLPGSVRVIGYGGWTYDDVYARFSNFGLWIPHVQPSSDQLVFDQLVIDGPQFNIDCLSAIGLINSLYHTRKAHLEYRFSGDWLGGIDSLCGYPATDLGRGTFPITELSLRIDIRRADVVFEITGQCGPGLPWTFHDNKSPERLPQFDIKFSVNDANLVHFFDQEGHVAAFMRNRDAYVFNR